MDRLPKALPPRSDILEAYRDLKTPDVFQMEEYRARLTSCDLRENVTRVEEFPDALAPGISDFRPVTVMVRSPEILRFYRSFKGEGERRAIPLYLAWVDEQAGQILHGLYDDRLHDLHFEALRELGMDIAKRMSYKVQYLDCGVWEVRKAHRQSEEAVMEQKGYVRSPHSGEWQTRAERIAEAEEYGRRLAMGIHKRDD